MPVPHHSISMGWLGSVSCQCKESDRKETFRYQNLACWRIEIITLSETFIKITGNVDDLKIENFVFYHKPRNDRPGGEIGIYIKDNMLGLVRGLDARQYGIALGKRSGQEHINSL